jgi:protein-S-isoprenylcysteine O-methyltransferase Ste14
MTIQATMMPADRKKADGLVGRLAYGSFYCLVLPAAMALWLNRLDQFMPAMAMPRAVWGSAAISAGLTIMAWSMLVMIRHGRGLPMNAYPTQAWVTAGPFRVFSHPIYAAFVMTVAGTAIVARSTAGLYVGAPVAAASAAALVLGYEGLATRRRLGARPFQPWVALPEAGIRHPSLAERVRALVLVFGVWLGLFLSLATLPAQPGAITTWLPFEAAMPFTASATALYIMTYGWVVMPAFAVRDVWELRRFCIVGLTGTAIGCSIYLLFPAMTPPRGVPGPGILANLLSLERANDSVATAMPSFHVFWAVVAAAFLVRATSSPTLKAAISGFSAAQIAACHLAGMHSLVDIAAGLVLAAAALNIRQINVAALRLAETVANEWRPIRIGRIRVFPHAAYVAAAAMTGLLISVAFMPNDGIWALALPVAGFVGAGVWGHAVEGTHFSRPFGFFGGLFGAAAATPALFVAGVLMPQATAAMAIGLPFAQAIGRLRCLAQGCCHGSACDHGALGLRYRHPLSRVMQVECLAGKPLKPAPVASIAFNVLIGAALARMAIGGLDAVLILSAYLVLTGLGRFVEEGMRGEPQTPVWRGLSLYQWLCVGLVSAGLAVTFLPCAGALSGPVSPGWGGFAIAASISMLWVVGLSVDWPWSGWRFSRLAPLNDSYGFASNPPLCCVLSVQSSSPK